MLFRRGSAATLAVSVRHRGTPLAMRSARPITLLVLLVLAVGINYVDRGALSVAETNVSAEFDLDKVEMGLLFSTFFWSYALFQIAAGWFVDRYDVKWVYAAGFFVWSL